MKYVLITPARNEGAFIKKTLDSMLVQTVRPERWVIVDDGSTDNTAEIVVPFAEQVSWIELLRREQRADRNFAGKVYAFRGGLERVQSIDFDIIGNLDADISFDSDYLEFLIRKFDEDPKLGVAGTPFTENSGYDTTRDSFEGENHVAGGCQLFRRQCFEEIGGYVPNRVGGIDWVAVTTARMRGWKTRSFPEKRFHHYRSLGTAERSVLSSLFSYGEKDYYLGGSPVWQVFRVMYRMAKRPILIGGLALLSGYCWAALRRMQRPVSRELIRFHRREQMKKLRAIFRTILRFKKVDSFSLVTERSNQKSEVGSQRGVPLTRRIVTTLKRSNH
jgi:poly-beta-1,6-N-acetyl-D-glucosamine synthase